MKRDGHDHAVKLAADQWYRVQSPSSERCMEGAIAVYLIEMEKHGWKLTRTEPTKEPTP